MTREIRVLEILVNDNRYLESSARCGTNITCDGIACANCPMYANNGGADLGSVRSRLRVLNEAHQACSVAPQEIEGVRTPSHYMLFEDVESIQVIARTMTVAEFKGFCLGNVLKYRLRAGKKSELATIEKDLAKADFYKELFTKHKGECRAAE